MSMNNSRLMRSHALQTSRQSGFALIVGLVVLVLLTLIMLTALKMASLEERMAGNLRNQNIAFQAAESALREAEGIIRSSVEEVSIDWDGDGTEEANPFNPLRLSGGPFQNTSAPLCVHGLCGDSLPLQSAAIRTLSNAEVRSAGLGIAGLPREPQYVVELMTIEPSSDARRLYATFRITARAWGEDFSGGDTPAEDRAASMVQLQSTYRAHIQSFVH